jgi:hypothetical protein
MTFSKKFEIIPRILPIFSCIFCNIFGSRQIDHIPNFPLAIRDGSMDKELFFLIPGWTFRHHGMKKTHHQNQGHCFRNIF